MLACSMRCGDDVGEGVCNTYPKSESESYSDDGGVSSPEERTQEGYATAATIVELVSISVAFSSCTTAATRVDGPLGRDDPAVGTPIGVALVFPGMCGIPVYSDASGKGFGHELDIWPAL